MKYYFILGANPTLSIAELAAIFHLDKGRIKPPGAELIAGAGGAGVFILPTDKKINALALIKKIGGTIKIGCIKNIAASADRIVLREGIKKILRPAGGKPRALIAGRYTLRQENAEYNTAPTAQGVFKKVRGKFYFGVSNYTQQKINIKTLGMEIKKYLRQAGVNSRWVISREPILSSVVVEQNKLVSDNGIEIVLIKNPPSPLYQGGILIGQTLAVQPFKELSFRDYGRPGRDDYAGMLPPKLAQMMINLALSPSPYAGGISGSTAPEAVEPLILDPFCGSGTILTEAMLMGYKNIIGADISKKAVENARKNIEWTRTNFQVSILNFQLFNRGALELSKFIKQNSIDAIITEPYLGPPRGRIDIKKVKKELENLYSKGLTEFQKILKNSGRVVMIWPVFRTTDNSPPAIQDFIIPELNGFKIINPIPENLRKNRLIKLTPLERNLFPKKSLHSMKALTGLTQRDTIIYGRADQKIWREIVVLGKDIKD